MVHTAGRENIQLERGGVLNESRGLKKKKEQKAKTTLKKTRHVKTAPVPSEQGRAESPGERRRGEP